MNNGTKSLKRKASTVISKSNMTKKNLKLIGKGTFKRVYLAPNAKDVICVMDLFRIDNIECMLENFIKEISILSCNFSFSPLFKNSSIQTYKNNDLKQVTRANIICERWPYTLYDVIYRQKHLMQQSKTRITIIGSLIKRVYSLHNKGFLHRDLKPMNIVVNQMITDVRLIDFGATLFNYFDVHEINYNVCTHHYLHPKLNTIIGKKTRLIDYWPIILIWMEMFNFKTFKTYFDYRANPVYFWNNEQILQSLNDDFESKIKSSLIDSDVYNELKTLKHYFESLLYADYDIKYPFQDSIFEFKDKYLIDTIRLPFNNLKNCKLEPPFCVRRQHAVLLLLKLICELEINIYIFFHSIQMFDSMQNIHKFNDFLDIHNKEVQEPLLMLCCFIVSASVYDCMETFHYDITSLFPFFESLNDIYNVCFVVSKITQKLNAFIIEPSFVSLCLFNKTSQLYRYYMNIAIQFEVHNQIHHCSTQQKHIMVLDAITSNMDVNNFPFCLQTQKNMKNNKIKFRDISEIHNE